ncbi:6307_t:CDS:1 [Paraglomus occultum]|uniref:6307_t:CDS:1 n=1 Tax=Paraglomus occultum TaxID=144539 RepID=A0A9N9C0L2_9GLOM|nr:6307_t:CDS:1 [Paraglomus occultum]
MKYHLLFLFFVLTAISTINAVPHLHKKGKTEFRKCPLPVKSTTPTITISPDLIVAGQLVEFSISGVELSKAVPIYIAFYKDVVLALQTPTALISKVDNPITVKAPPSLPEDYTVVIGFTDILSGSKPRIYCALAAVGGSSHVSVEVIEKLLSLHHH